MVKIVNKASELSSEYAYSKYIIERYIKLFGLKETIELLKANEIRINKSIRVNSLSIDPDILIERLERKGFEFERIPWDSNGFYVKKSPFSIGAAIEYLLGYYYVQKAASMIPAIILAPNERDTVLDMCAAPGGKLVQIANLMENQGCLIGLDLDMNRIRSLKSNISRMKISNTIIYRMDATDFGGFDFKVDKILLDAPCTGSGLIPFDKSRKTSRTYEDIIFCSKIQQELLRTAIKVLKNNGIIVYSTCSISPEENELVIDKILQEYENIKVTEINLKFGEKGMANFFCNRVSEELMKAKRFYPHKNGTQGFFICKLKKIGQ
ncbi:MAG: NOL1/NOP2/sun family putative RNA methylase [Candidatus Lokiarchaeota archaeon]|nr:NOL1/NOP2/sun family putative RNA methylase [Candidatus Lokiarchaeota archaeon]